MTSTHTFSEASADMSATRHAALDRIPGIGRANDHPKTHPALAYYGENTLSHEFPLILVVGREPQADEEMLQGTVGSYDFAAHPRCAFWNVAYRMIARSTGQPEFGTAAFKRECVQRKASPIVFADALPIGLSNRNDARAKHLLRATVLEAAVDRHVAGVCALDIMKRAQLVILAGHQPPHFRYATAVYRRHLRAAGKPFIETAFFYPTNCRKIETQIGQANGWATLRTLLAKFRDAT